MLDLLPMSSYVSMEELIESTIATCFLYFHEWRPDKDLDFFNENILVPLSKKNELIGENVYLDFKDDKKFGKFAAPLYICLGYVVESRRLLSNGDRENSWQAIAEARYWAGQMAAMKGMDSARIKTISATRSNVASNAGKASAERFEPVRQELYRLVREEKPEGTLWTSMRYVVGKFKDRVLEYAKKKDLAMSSAQAQVTFANYLRDMPDRLDFIRERKHGRRK